MGLWAIKYADEDEKWWVDMVCQDGPPGVARGKVGARVVVKGFSNVMGPVLVRKASIPADAFEDWPTDTPIVLTRAEIAPDLSLSSSS